MHPALQRFAVRAAACAACVCICTSASSDTGMFPVSPIDLPGPGEWLHASEMVAWYHDRSGELTAADFLGDARALLEPGSPAGIRMGFTQAPIWIAFELRNEQAWTREVVAEIANPRVGLATLYEVVEERPIVRRSMGVRAPRGTREYEYPSPAFRITLDPRSTSSFLMRVEHSGSARFRFLLWDPGRFVSQTNFWAGASFFVLGALAVMAALQFIIYLDLREPGYFLLSLFTATFTIYELTHSGVGHLYVWPEMPLWADRSVTLTLLLCLAMGIFFLIVFLDATTFAPRLSRALFATAIGCIVLAPFCLFDFVAKYYLAYALGCIAAALTLALCIVGARQRTQFARALLVTWGVGVLVVLFLSLIGPGLLPSAPATEYGLQATFLVAIVLWSLALTDRVKMRQREAREVLEREVEARTADLQKALADVRTLGGLLPICSKCKKIRDDKGYWNSVEQYLKSRTDATFTHGLCPECIEELYPEQARRMRQRRERPSEGQATS